MAPSKSSTGRPWRVIVPLPRLEPGLARRGLRARHRLEDPHALQNRHARVELAFPVEVGSLEQVEVEQHLGVGWRLRGAVGGIRRGRRRPACDRPEQPQREP